MSVPPARRTWIAYDCHGEKLMYAIVGENELHLKNSSSTSWKKRAGNNISEPQSFILGKSFGTELTFLPHMHWCCLCRLHLGEKQAAENDTSQAIKLHPNHVGFMQRHFLRNQEICFEICSKELLVCFFFSDFQETKVPRSGGEVFLGNIWMHCEVVSEWFHKMLKFNSDAT